MFTLVVSALSVPPIVSIRLPLVKADVTAAGGAGFAGAGVNLMWSEDAVLR